ncbi:bifunctional folylpolyglutamate synthase/dihydrofolate synthase [Hoeflea prorocentri]|uniref:tetrahydrofolate synthase n=1 Tax=Hoeflea prorocentri TaxID=1922333 RepID=A0A9X3ULU3_9HYPH|nr:folylpolyglutamate synthase/dihydrofolate synthase family protein [Hoeflea prorocentri]MCY6383123.1 bifunctional folylpolyglutamate synthase/dihydrofolate synthase [Hoeflea prorocentri]MDA5400923.1 bifunctional folylpolyglutamate synthase/dihydrofolate synthase [Hoeflea prorocentri]
MDRKTVTQTTAADEIEHLMRLHPKGYDLSLGRVERLLEKLGNPQDRLPPVIHIAGTNGKGSAGAFCRAILEAEGLAVHVHTSPHLVHWHERFRIGEKARPGQLVDDAVLAEAIRRVAKANDGEAITVFEILTAVAFLLFAEHPADATVMEVGLGGRFDATNVMKKPAVSLIMPISLDHQAYLGDRVELIAAEKAGIIKAGVPVVVGFQQEDAARDTVVATADRLGCTLSVYGQDYHAHEEHGRLVYQDEMGLSDLTLPQLPGRHQLSNAAAAIRALKAAGFNISDRAIEEGLQQAKWPGRMQPVTDGPLIDEAVAGAEIWIDGGHNPAAGHAIAEMLAELEERKERPLFLVSGMINTKDPVGYFAAFAGMARHVYTVPVQGSDAGIDPVVLAEDAASAGLSSQPASDVMQALAMMREDFKDMEAPPRILIGGSLYLIGDILAENGLVPS